MDSNHEWQRHRTQQQLGNRRHTAEAERQVREATGMHERAGVWVRLLAFLQIRPPVPRRAGEEAPHKPGARPT